LKYSKLILAILLVILFSRASAVKVDGEGRIENDPIDAPSKLDYHLVEIYEPDSNLILMQEETTLFTFNTSQIEIQEGCTDSLVYPGGGSGPTISCGLDIGNVGSRNLDTILMDVVSDSIKQILMSGVSISGPETIKWIQNNQIHLGQHIANMICNRVKRVFWLHIRRKFPNLENAPDAVKSAMLSFCIQTGTYSKRLRGFDKAIEDSNWNGLANLMAASYTDWNGGKYHALYLRRIKEAKIIQLELTKPDLEISYD